MDYDGKFEFNGEVINYMLDRANYKVKHPKKFEEDPMVSSGFNLFFEYGKTYWFPVWCRQHNLTSLTPDFVKSEYIEHLKEIGQYK